MREAELKALTLAELRYRRLLRPGDIIASEYVVAGSARRADLAVMSRHFIGIEIKSEFDTLKRLGGQLATYASTFDKVILVVAEKHAAAALREVPDGIEVWQFDSAGKCIVLIEGAAAEPHIEGRLALLTTSALKRLVGGSPRASRRELMRRGTTVHAAILDRELRSFFAERYGSTTLDFWAQCKGRKVRASHIPLLSVYSPSRRAQIAAQIEERAFWRNWALVAATEMSQATW